jgi:hypothetical protein
LLVCAVREGAFALVAGDRKRVGGKNEPDYVSPTMTQFPSLYRGCHSIFVHEAFTKIEEYYRQGANLLSLEESDEIRLNIVANDLQTQCIPLVEDLKQMPNVPKPWADEVSKCVIALEKQLRWSTNELQGINTGHDGYVFLFKSQICLISFRKSVRMPGVVKIVASGHGRPSKQISSAFLKNALRSS